jgi:hypothetical protein
MRNSLALDGAAGFTSPPRCYCRECPCSYRERVTVVLDCLAGVAHIVFFPSCKASIHAGFQAITGFSVLLDAILTSNCVSNPLSCKDKLSSRLFTN